MIVEKREEEQKGRKRKGRAGSGEEKRQGELQNQRFFRDFTKEL